MAIPNPFRVKRGTSIKRLDYIPLAGELVYDVETKKLYVGDGLTLGGLLIGGGGTTDTTDTTAPSIPTGLSATKTDTSVTLSWTASTDPSGIKAYGVYRGGNKVGEVISGLSFTENNLLPGTPYSYSVDAVDGANNRSVKSDPFSVTTNGTSTATTTYGYTIEPFAFHTRETGGIIRDVGGTNFTLEETNGTVDATAKIQAVIKEVEDAGIGGTVNFLAGGTYKVTNLHINPLRGVNLIGNGCTLVRPDDAGGIEPILSPQGKWTYDPVRTFACRGYSGTVPSPVVHIEGFTINTRMFNQGKKRALDDGTLVNGMGIGYAQEHSHAIFLDGSSAARLRVNVKNVTILNAISDGVSVFANTDARIQTIRATNGFRGTLTLTGGNSYVRADDIIADAGPDTAENKDELGNRYFGPIDCEVDPSGPQPNPYKAQLLVTNSDFGGHSDVEAKYECDFMFHNVKFRRPFHAVTAFASRLTFITCEIAIGCSSNAFPQLNRVKSPKVLKYLGCKINLHRDVHATHYPLTAGADFLAINIKWDSYGNEPRVWPNGTINYKVEEDSAINNYVRLEDCTWAAVGPTWHADDYVDAVHIQAPSSQNTNARVEIINPTIPNTFKRGVVIPAGVYGSITGGSNLALTPVQGSFAGA